jgi:predicted hydrocarbon binding protein
MRQHFVKARFGATGAELFKARASAELRVALSLAPQRDDWVDFGLFVEATELVDRLFGRGDLAIAWEVGRYAAEHNMGVWRSLVMRVMSPSIIMGIATSLWTHHYDSGKLVIREESDGEKNQVRVSISDFRAPHRTHCMSVGGWIERTLELGRPKSVRVRETSCRARHGATCEFALTWK